MHKKLWNVIVANFQTGHTLNILEEEEKIFEDKS